MSKLETTFAGVKMRSPLSVAAIAAPTAAGRMPQAQIDKILSYVEAGAGCVYTPGTTTTMEQPLEYTKGAYRVAPARIPGFNRMIGKFSVCDPYVVPHSLHGTLDLIHALKERLPEDVPVIGDIIGSGADPAGWVYAAELMVQAGADLIEIDAACPFTAGTTSADHRLYSHSSVAPDADSELARMGVAQLLADLAEPLQAVTKAVVASVAVPVGVKLSPESGFPRNLLIMKAVARAGGKYQSSINSLLTVAPPDINREGRPIFPFVDFNPVCSITGPVLYPMVTRNIGTGAVFVPELDHSAVGGIVSPQQVVELLMLGAKHVGLASAIYMTEGVSALRRYNGFLLTYMDKHGYENVDALIGVALKYRRPVTRDVDWGNGRIVARVDYDKCTECGRCIEGLCFGVIVEDAGARGRPIVKEELCGACGFCTLICPEGAYSLVESEQAYAQRLEW